VALLAVLLFAVIWAVRLAPDADAQCAVEPRPLSGAGEFLETVTSDETAGPGLLWPQFDSLRIPLPAAC